MDWALKFPTSHHMQLLKLLTFQEENTSAGSSGVVGTTGGAVEDFVQFQFNSNFVCLDLITW